MPPPFLLLRFQVHFIKKWRLEKFGNANLKSLADFMYDAKFYRIIRTVENVMDGGFGNAAFHIQLVLGHIVFLQ